MATMNTDNWDLIVIDNFFVDARNNTAEIDPINPFTRIVHAAYTWLHEHDTIEDYHIYQAWFAVRHILMYGSNQPTKYLFLEQMDYCPTVFMKCFSSPCKLSEYSKIAKQLHDLVKITTKIIDKIDYYFSYDMTIEPEMLSYYFNPADRKYDDADDYYDIFDSECYVATHPYRYRHHEVEKIYKRFMKHHNKTKSESDCPDDDFRNQDVSDDEIATIKQTINMLTEIVESYNDGKICMKFDDMITLKEELLPDVEDTIGMYPF